MDQSKLIAQNVVSIVLMTVRPVPHCQTDSVDEAEKVVAEYLEDKLRRAAVPFEELRDAVIAHDTCPDHGTLAPCRHCPLDSEYGYPLEENKFQYPSKGEQD